jgi:hypothetical protein
MKAKISNTV